MLNLEIIRIQDENPRWTMNIYGYNKIGYYENQIINEISILLEEKNNIIDKDENEPELPFN